MGDYSSLYKYEKFEIIGDELVPLGIFSVDGNGTMPLVVKDDCDPQCGCPEPIYQWIQTEDTVCIEVITYKLQATYSDSSTLNVECDSSTSLLKAESQPTGYTASAMTDAIIGDCVTTIGNNATNAPFNGCRSLTAVTIPNSVTTIGSWAFGNCINLSNVTIPDSVTIIDYGGFNNCERLTAVTFGSGVTTIGESAFGYCRSLSSITIPNSVTTIGNWAFEHCSGLTSIELPNSVASLSRGIFSDCTSLPSVTLPNTVLSIGDDVFYGCSSLTSVTIPSALISIGSNAFQYCYNLVSVNIPDGVTQIHSQTFYGCSSLTSVTIPSRVFTIDTNAFRNCTSLTSVTIPSSVTTIERYAFYGCSGLTSITIPSGVTSIGEGAFSWCSGLTAIYVEPTTPPALYGSFWNTGDCPIYVPCESVDSYKAASGWSDYASRIEGIPPCGQPTPTGAKFTLTLSDSSIVTAECDSTSAITTAETSDYHLNIISATIGDCVTTIGDEAFNDCMTLTSVTIPNSVTTIGNNAFNACDLHEINLPNTLINLGDGAFKYCQNLQDVYIPVGYVPNECFSHCPNLEDVDFSPNTTTIDFGAFSSCYSLESIEIPSAIESINYEAFKNCENLASVYVHATTPPTLRNDSFDGTPIADGTGTIYVPSESVNAYKAASGWSTYASQIQAIP